MGTAALSVAAAAVGYLSQFGSGGPYRDENGKYTHVSVSSSFSHIADHPAFAGFGDYIVPWESGPVAMLTAPLSVEKIAPYLGAWDPRTMVDGVNFLIDQVNAGRTLFHHIYTPEEITEDPSKKAAGVFFVPGRPDAPTTIVMAGGGFTSVASIQEAFPHARALHALGYNVFVLKYRVGAHDGDKAPDKLDRIRRANEDVARAMALIEDRAEDWKVDLNGYAIWGSSAGGRLALLWGSDSEFGAEAHGAPEPAAVIAVYPGIGDPFRGSAASRPTFITVAQDDDLVSVPQLDDVVAGLRALGVPVEYRKAASGGHGFGLGVGTDAEGWFDHAVAFWERHRADGG
ncbi:hypothetical protein GCM10022221_49180 [Actinocorallia aurea]